jgi:hypothetical protein
MVSGVRLVKAVAEVVRTVILKGDQGGADAVDEEGGTKKFGNVPKVKLIALASTVPTVPVIWLGSSVMLFVVKVAGPGPDHGVQLPDPLAGVTDP